MGLSGPVGGVPQGGQRGGGPAAGAGAREKDPIKERQRQRREAARNLHLLSDVARDALESRRAELKGNGLAGRWFSPLELHVLPKLGRSPVGEITRTDIRDARGSVAQRA